MVQLTIGTPQTVQTFDTCVLLQSSSIMGNLQIQFRYLQQNGIFPLDGWSMNSKGRGDCVVKSLAFDERGLSSNPVSKALFA